jgi:N-acetylglucosamine kinase-like BadF-type ATPase
VGVPAVSAARPAVLALDGGNSKTEVVLVAADGTVLARVVGPGSNPDHLGVQGCFDLLDLLVRQAAALAGQPAGTTAGSTGTAEADGFVADVAGAYLAGADLPREMTTLQEAAERAGWAPHAYVENDTFALLRAGTDEPDAVAVVCGAGINCVGVGADGAQVRFAALGPISGDWGGGRELGDQALWWGAREEDGRGPATALTRLVAEHFALPSASAVTEAIHFGELSAERLVELAPGVLAAAGAGDAVASGVVERLAEEVALLATTSLRRLGLLARPATVVLGGGVLAGREPVLLDSVTRRLAQAAPCATVRVVSEPPVLGAALAALDVAGAPQSAGVRLREQISGARPRS